MKSSACLGRALLRAETVERELVVTSLVSDAAALTLRELRESHRTTAAASKVEGAADVRSTAAAAVNETPAREVKQGATSSTGNGSKDIGSKIRKVIYRVNTRRQREQDAERLRAFQATEGSLAVVFEARAGERGGNFPFPVIATAGNVLRERCEEEEAGGFFLV